MKFLNNNLAQKVARAIGWGIVGTMGYQLLGLAIFVMLSRILSPEEIGRVALAMAVVELLNIVVHLGMVEIIIRRGNLSDVQKSTIFWICAITGVLFSLTIYMLSDSFEKLIGAEGTGAVLRWLSIIPLLHSLSVLPDAELKKQLRYKELTIRLIATTTIAGFISLAFAYYGFGEMALVFQRISSFILTLIILWLAYGQLKVNKFSWPNAIDLIGEGKSIAALSLTNLGVYRLLEILIGYYLGVAAVGYYKVASKLYDFVIQLFLKPIIDVSMATFALVKDGKESLLKTYNVLLFSSSIASIPAFVGLVFICPEIVVIIFGDAWYDSGIALQIISATCLANSIAFLFYPLMNSTNNTSFGVSLKFFEILLMAAGIVLVTQVFKPSLTTILGVYVCSVTFSAIISIFISKCRVGTSWLGTLNSLTPSVFCSSIMGVALYYIKYFLLVNTEYLNVFVLVFLGVVIYAAMMYLVFKSKIKYYISSYKKLAK